ncbi:phosphatidate cytidylyltransferase [Streptomyces indicus]|uniref:Phosphatidate cytidylyltransferase n=1 Tax=Streptomyces indicus TaxID=417292 RepID=A0A1G8VX90_9ACTN|nr:phosphatidate cytidylyltransferase [Streptomyces indicus]SDJ70694.1 phosphatidate cytidylyltransferase [Streptomyces indicus]
MNDSSWGAPPQAGYWGPPEMGPVQGRPEAGPAYDEPEVQQTRPMPVVSEADDAAMHTAAGADQDQYGTGATRLSGPLFRDEMPQEPMPSAAPSPSGEPYEPPRHAAPQAGAQGVPQNGLPQNGAPQHGLPQNGAQQHGLPQEPVDAPAPAVPAASASVPPTAPQKKRAGRDLRAAIGVGVGLGAVIIASLFIVKAVFVGVIAVAVVVGLWELTARLQERKQIKAPLVPLAVGGAAMVVAGYVRGAEGAWVAMALTALAVLVWRMTEPPEGYLKDVTAGVFAAFYVPFLATFVALMLTADDGPQRVLTFLLLTVVSDTGAYAVGWRFGKTKLAPRISPGKTREGLLGAVSFAMVAGALCMQFLIDDGTWWQGLLLGLAVAASATLGDLGESMIKRDLGIKDMGTLLPGHGGIMDRLDSLLPTAPVVWLLFVVFVGSG